MLVLPLSTPNRSPAPQTPSGSTGLQSDAPRPTHPAPGTLGRYHVSYSSTQAAGPIPHEEQRTFFCVLHVEEGEEGEEVRAR
eukprot:9271885-Alexandrium_andersonii.AAC.1